MSRRIIKTPEQEGLVLESEISSKCSLKQVYEFVVDGQQQYKAGEEQNCLISSLIEELSLTRGCVKQLQ